MKKNKIHFYWLLAAVIIAVSALGMAVGDTRARYLSTTTSVAVLDTTVKHISSNCLVSAEEPARTVLLGEMTDETVTEIPFWLLSEGEDVKVRLNYGVADPACADYLSVQVLAGAEVLEAGTELELLQDIRLELKLVLALTEAARHTAHPSEPVTVHVTAGDSLWGTFLVTVPEGTAATVSGNDAVSGGDAVSGNDMVSGNGTVSGGDAAVAAEEDTVSGNDAGQAVPEQDISTSELILKTLSAYKAGQQLPVQLYLPEQITSVRLGIAQTAEEGRVTLSPLPDYTMFSADGGNSYYMIYGELIPELVVQGITNIPLLFDLRYACLPEDGLLTMAAEAYRGAQSYPVCTAVTLPAAAAQPQSSAAQEPESLSGAVLDYSNRLEFSFPQEWKEAVLTYTVEYLTMTEGRTLQYIPVELSDDTLQAVYDKEADLHQLTLHLGPKFTSPGTYRISLTWSYEGLDYDMTQTTFFVNCSGKEEPTAGGLEVRNDE